VLQASHPAPMAVGNPTLNVAQPATFRMGHPAI